jgi:hypothetical protein
VGKLNLGLATLIYSIRLTRVKPSRVAIVAMIFFGLLFPTASAQGTFSKPLDKSIQSQIIICTKGNVIKKVSGTKPKCPTGYKKKVAQTNQITFSLLPSYSIGSALIDLTGTSSASLPVSYRSNSPLICSISQNQVQLIVPGKCRITATQNGAKFIDRALPLTVSFDVIGQNVISVISRIGDAKISDQRVAYHVVASSGLPVRGQSVDPGVCNLSADKIQFIYIGLCQIRWNQLGNEFYSVADPVLTSFRISQANQITFSLAPSYKIGLKAIDSSGTSSASLPLSYQSATPSVCTFGQNQVQLLSPGKCTITAAQDGAEFVDKAAPVTVSFDVIGQNTITFNLPNSLLLGLKTYPLAGKSSSGLPVTYESQTPDSCSVSITTLTLNKVGTCTVHASQVGSNYYEPAQSVEVSTGIVGSRVTADQPDKVTGFQIKAIYVVPADGMDHSYDTNGYIANILDEGNSYLKEQLGLQLQIDRTNLGYDIQFMKSKITTSEFMHSPDLLEQLLNELKAMEDPGANRKNYTFFVDVPILKDGGACGYGREPGMFSIVAIGASCSGPSQTFRNYASPSWVHENFHNFGVGHFNDTCDLMNNPQNCTSDQRPTIDKEKTRYVGASTLGVGDKILSQNILLLRVWDGYTSRTDLLADCILVPGTRSDGLKFAYCPTGTQTIGALTYCWQSITSDSLEELIDGTWVSLGSGSNWNEPWGARFPFKCTASYAPWKQITVTTPGIHHYRWIVNGGVAEELNIIWVQ